MKALFIFFPFLFSSYKDAIACTLADIYSSRESYLCPAEESNLMQLKAKIIFSHVVLNVVGTTVKKHKRRLLIQIALMLFLTLHVNTNVV